MWIAVLEIFVEKCSYFDSRYFGISEHFFDARRALKILNLLSLYLISIGEVIEILKRSQL